MIDLPFFKKPVKNLTIKPLVLIVLDGWGIAPASTGNAIYKAKTPNMDKYLSSFPQTQLIAAGESVGLPANEVGNSEVGHLTIGAGRAVYQSLKRINVAIENGLFFENPAFLKAVEHTKSHGSKLHLIGLIGSGNVHSSTEHFYALLEFCKRQELRGVLLHLFTDGRDAPPQESVEIVSQIETRLTELNVAKIASISGRYYAMDRDMRWERTQRAYEAIVMGRGVQKNSASEAIRFAYSQGQTDEFIAPSIVAPNARPVGVVDDNDAVIFFNFRIDRPRQLTMAFVLSDFENLKAFEFGHVPDQGKKEAEVVSGPTFKRMKWPKNLFFVTMTEYQRKLPVSAVAFPPEKIIDTLTEVISKNNLRQLHLAESEKERMVTFYFDGMREQLFQGEDVIIVPSAKVATYDKKPEMSVYEIANVFERQLERDTYHFFVMNFANCDMVAHSGDLNATIKAVEHVDKALGQVVEKALSANGTVVISADHGNAEELLTYPTGSFFFTTASGELNTDHSNNPVPIIFINKNFEKKPRKLAKGSFSDIAPSILGLMGLEVPTIMTGRNLLK